MEAGSNTANLLGLARSALLAGNHSEALTYFNRVLEADPTISDAWIGKAAAAGWQSTLVNIRVNEMLVAVGHAIATAPPEKKQAVTDEGVSEINKVIVAVYNIARNHLMQYVAVQNVWTQYVQQVAQLIDGLEANRQIAPSNRDTLDNIVHLCKDNIEGVSYRDPFDNNAPKAWTLGPNYEQLLTDKRNAAAEAIRQSDPTYVSAAIEKKKAEACFVVTATMGDFDHPTVTFMRSFRDEWMANKPLGRFVINVYYKVGPHAASYIAKSDKRRTASYRFIVAPAARLAEKLMK